MGYNDTAWGKNSIAMGFNCFAEGEGNIAIGYNTKTTNPFAIAIGHNAYGIADKSVALGNNISTNNKNGSFIFGDGSTSVITKNTALNQMMMRFAGGYRLYSNTALTQGVYMPAGTSGWSNISDRNAKEGFSDVDGEKILKSIQRMPVTSWAYKGSDSAIRYIGPMAQDFHQEFGLGGSDSLGINSISMDGVNMAAVKALIDRTDELKDTQKSLVSTEAKVAKQDEEIEELRKEMESLKRMINRGQRKGFFARLFSNNKSK
jgi:trimeric autotransporter adhesin